MRIFWPTDKNGKVVGIAGRLPSDNRDEIEAMFEEAVDEGQIKPGQRGYLYVAGFKISYHLHHRKADHLALNIM